MSNAAHNRTNIGVNPWLMMAFMAIPIFVGSLDLTVVSAFLPELVIDLGLPFDTGLDDASWIITGYLLAYTVSLTFTGRLSDLLGRRSVYAVCLMIFIAGSMIIATLDLNPMNPESNILYMFYRRIGQRPDIAYVNLQIIIFGRIVQALGAGALVPVSLALVGDLFPPEHRARPLGLVAAMDTLGWVLGHLYGALFLQIPAFEGWWQGLFWVNLPLTLLALFAVIYGMRKIPRILVKGRFDFMGTLLIVGALTCLSIGLGANIDVSPTAGLDDLTPLPDYALPVLGAGVLMFLGFLLVESRVRDPLVNLRMFRRQNLTAASVANLVIGYCLFIGLVSVPLLINIRQEDSSTLTQAALEVGVLLSALTVPMALAAVPGGWLSERIGIRNTVILGLFIAAGGFISIWQTWTIDISSSLVALEMLFVGVGIGLTFSPISTAIINSAYDEERGVASALILILRLVGMTVSVASLTTYGLTRINMLIAEASAGMETTTFDTDIFLNLYSDSTVVVLGEMGLIGAILCGVALIPAFFLGREATTPPRDEVVESNTFFATGEEV